MSLGKPPDYTPQSTYNSALSLASIGKVHSKYVSRNRQIWPRFLHFQSTILAQDMSRKEMIAQGLGIGFLEPQDGLLLMREGKARPHGLHFVEISLWVVLLEKKFRPLAELLQNYIQERYETLDLRLLFSDTAQG